MTESDRWRVLDVNDDTVRNLLIKASLPDASKNSRDGYVIRVSDLSRIWGEALSKDVIIARASEKGCSIDPSEDDEQYGILLNKIRSALDKEPGTSMSLTRRPGAEEDLLLTLSAPLPVPLPMLTWTMSLTSLPPEILGSDLVMPLLHQASSLQRKIRMLIQEIHDKDRIISKITDRLETSGNDLTTVFPGVSNIKTNRKRSQRQQLAAHVRGLGDFDTEKVNKIPVCDSHDNVSHDVLKSIFESLPLQTPSWMGDSALKHWWRRLPLRHGDGESVPRGDLVESDSENIVQPGDNTADEDASMVDGDDFQRQATPPHLKNRGGEHDEAQSLFVSQRSAPPAHVDANPADDDSTTDDDDDLDAPQPKSKAMQIPQQSVASSTTHRQGTANEQSQSAPEPRETIPTASHAVESHSEIGTFGVEAGEEASTVSKLSEPVQAMTHPRPGSRLGTLGGRAKVQVKTEPTEEPTPPSNQPSRQILSNASPSMARLGLIGGKKMPKPGPSPQLPAVNEGSAGEIARETSPLRSRKSTKEATPQLRETSQERADRKRDQLKRELEEKAKAPAKKKRKF